MIGNSYLKCMDLYLDLFPFFFGFIFGFIFVLDLGVHKN